MRVLYDAAGLFGITGTFGILGKPLYKSPGLVGVASVLNLAEIFSPLYYLKCNTEV